MATTKFTVTLVGHVETQAKLDALAPKALAIIGPALFTRAGKIMTLAKETRVPVALSTLKTSGYVKPPQLEKANHVTVTLGFGGAAKDYALIQHENMTFHHPGQGGPKYLSGPAEEAKADVEHDVEKAVREAIT